MQKFDHVLLASDFDNTLVYTQGALERGEDIPPMSARNREAVEYFSMMDPLFFSRCFSAKVYHGAGEMKRDVLRKDISR